MAGPSMGSYDLMSRLAVAFGIGSPSAGIVPTSRGCLAAGGAVARLIFLFFSRLEPC
jgi:hypothetical protein